MRLCVYANIVSLAKVNVAVTKTHTHSIYPFKYINTHLVLQVQWQEELSYKFLRHPLKTFFPQVQVASPLYHQIPSHKHKAVTDSSEMGSEF